MDLFNPIATTALLFSVSLVSLASAQEGTPPAIRFETPAALIEIYVDPSPTLQKAEERLADIRASYPEKLLIRAAFYQSEKDARDTEQQHVNTHKKVDGWRADVAKQRLNAASMAEAVAVNSYGIARAYNAGKTVTEVPAGLLSLEEISCSQSRMRFLYLSGGQIGPNMQNFVELYFQSVNSTSRLDAECLASKIGLSDLSPADLSISNQPFFPLDPNYPRFNRFIEAAYDKADRSSGPLNKGGPDYACLSIVRKAGVSCVTIEQAPE